MKGKTMDNTEVVKRIGELGNAINQAKAAKAKYEGAMEQILASLKQSIGLNSIEEAQAYVLKLDVEIKAKEAKVQEIYTELNNNYSW
jgi:hypothetical protein